LEQRLQKALAAAGVASRRRAEELIAAGRVAVDGKVVTTPGTQVDVETQTIAVDGKPIAAAPAKRHYIALHKPVGYVSTVRDRHAPRKVTDLVALPGVRLVPAGRLDADSEGLLLLSDDGDFVYRVTHPSHSVGKTYRATVKGAPDAATLRRLARGLALDDGVHTAPAAARRIGRGPEPGTSVVELVLHEGRNRQVRRMLETVGHPVVRLVRIKVGPIALGDLAPGAWRPLTGQEIEALTQGGKAAAKTKPGRKPGEQESRDETRHRGRSRPGPQQDNRGPAQKRVQIHQDRIHGRLPARGKRHPPDRRRGEGRGPGPGDHR
jgi:pseudouridine synthase